MYFCIGWSAAFSSFCFPIASLGIVLVLYVSSFGGVYFPDFPCLVQVGFCRHGLYPGFCTVLSYLLRNFLCAVMFQVRHFLYPFLVVDFSATFIILLVQLLL